MQPIPSYSNCPGEVYDNFIDYFTDEEAEELDAIIENSRKEEFTVVYHNKTDLTNLKKEFTSMKEALEFALERIEKDYVVNSVVTNSYYVTV
jgi:vacuolar-type H+-ATPase subunit I/STV1